MRSRELVIESQYFPSVAWMTCASSIGKVWVDQAENYNKRSLRNKTWLTQTDTQVALSIPLKKGKHSGQGIKTVEISFEENWQLNHVRAIQSVYGKSPYFIHYADAVIELIENADDRLYPFTKSTIIKTIGLLNLDIEIEDQQEFIRLSNGAYIVLRDQLKYSGIYSKLENEINLNITEWQDQTHLQFQLSPRSSILDLLFHLGPETRLFLNKIQPSILQADHR